MEAGVEGVRLHSRQSADGCRRLHQASVQTDQQHELTGSLWTGQNMSLNSLSSFIKPQTFYCPTPEVKCNVLSSVFRSDLLCLCRLRTSDS